MFKICRVQFLLCWQLNEMKEKNECGYGIFGGKICLIGHLSTDIHCHNAVSPTCQQGASSGWVSLLYRDNIQPPCLILAQWWNDKIIGFIKIPGTFGPHTMTGLTIVWPSRKKRRNVNRYLALALLLIYWAWWVHNYGIYKIYYFLQVEQVYFWRADPLLESWPTNYFVKVFHKDHWTPLFFKDMVCYINSSFLPRSGLNFI